MQISSLRRLPYPTVSTVLIVGSLLVLAGYLLFTNEWGTISVDAVDVGTSSNAPAETPRAAQQVFESMEAERRAVARTQLLRLSHAADEVRKLIADLRAEIAAWNTEILPLLENDSGRLVATNEQFVATCLEIFNHTGRAPADMPERSEVLLSSLIDPIKRALARPDASYEPSEDLESQLDGVRVATEDAIKSYREPRQQIQSMVSAMLRQKGAKPGPTTLKQATEALVEHRALANSQAVANALAEEQRKGQQALAQLEVEKVRNAAAREIARLRLEEEQRQKDAERELAQRREEGQRKAAADVIAEKRRRAADPAVQANYQPFLAKGRFMFHPGGARQYNPEGYRIPQPASFRRLRESGVLNNVVVFCKTGAAFLGGRQTNFDWVNYYTDKEGFASQGYQNDRPTWSGYPYSEAEWRYAEVRYREFLELAPYWIEMGVLKP